MSSEVMTQENWARLQVARRVKDIAKSMMRPSMLGRSIVPMGTLLGREELSARLKVSEPSPRRRAASAKAYPGFPVMPAFVVSKSPSEDAIQVSSDQVAAFRLSRQQLHRRSSVSSLARTAGDVAGVQAQILSASKIALWARTEGLRVEDVERALWEDRTLAKTWCMRGSLHLIPSRDFAVFVRGCARREARSTGWLARAGIPLARVERILAAIPDVLDKPLTRGELAVRIAESLKIKMKRRTGGGWGKSTESEGFAMGRAVLSVQGVVFLACMRGLACFGPMQGNETTFVRPDRWLPGWHDLPQDQAEEELLRRYLRAHGPASVADFAQWTYLK